MSSSSDKKREAFLIKNPTYQELEPLKWVKENVVDRCPYDGPAKLENEYRRQINLFFWHVLQSSLYPSKKKRFEKFGTVWVPISAKLGRRELPMVFGCKNAKRGPVGPKMLNRTPKHFTRALEWLVACVIDRKGYKKKTANGPGMSCEYRVKSVHIAQMYPQRPRSSREILELTRYYSPVQVVQENFGLTILEEIRVNANRPLKRRKHDLERLRANEDRKARQLYLKVLKKLGPNEIAIDPILEYLETKSFRKTDKAQRQFHQVLHCLLAIINGPIQIVSDKPLVIRYYPAYKLARIGGRLFEEGGGFQSFPAILKQRCSVVGTNWDMESSQLNIIREELAKYGIECSFLADINSVNDIAERVGLPKKLAKICFYATLFSVSTLVKSPKSSTYKALRPHFKNKDEVYQFLETWNITCIPFIQALRKLSAVYVEQFRITREGPLLRNDTHTPFLPNTHVGMGKRNLCRSTMSHQISGIESKRLFDAILSDNVQIVFSLEHDGALMQTGPEGIVSGTAKFVVKRFSDALDFMSDE